VPAAAGELPGSGPGQPRWRQPSEAEENTDARGAVGKLPQAERRDGTAMQQPVLGEEGALPLCRP